MPVPGISTTSSAKPHGRWPGNGPALRTAPVGGTGDLSAANRVCAMFAERAESAVRLRRWRHDTRPSADEHAQTSVSEHGDVSALGPPGVETAQKQHAGLLKLDAQPSAAESVFPWARHERPLLRSGELAFRDTYAASGPNREPGRILIPGDGAAGDQEAQNKPACPAMAATRRPRAIPSQRPPGAMVSGAHAVL